MCGHVTSPRPAPGWRHCDLTGTSRHELRVTPAGSGLLFWATLYRRYSGEGHLKGTARHSASLLECLPFAHCVTRSRMSAGSLLFFGRLRLFAPISHFRQSVSFCPFTLAIRRYYYHKAFQVLFVAWCAFHVQCNAFANGGHYMPSGEIVSSL